MSENESNENNYDQEKIRQNKEPKNLIFNYFIKLK